MGLFSNTGRKEKKIKETIDANDFYEGIKCSINKYTPPFGKITIYEFNDSSIDEISNSEFELLSNDVDTILQASDDGIIIKNATAEMDDLKIPFTNIIRANTKDIPKEFSIILIGNQKINASITYINEDNSIYAPKYVRDHIVSIINNFASGNQFDKKLECEINDLPLKKETHGGSHNIINNVGSPHEWAKEEIKKVEDNLYPILGKEGIFKLTNVLATIATEEGYEEALNYLEYTTYRVNYYNNKKKDYLIESKLADNVYKSYVTDGISRLDKVNGRFMAAQNMKLDILIEQNTKIIQLLEKIAKK